MSEIKTILITGGAGYVGSALIPKLLKKGYKVKVIDLYLYGEDVFDGIKSNPNLVEIKGDIRDRELLEKELPGCYAVIHLACISNDPSFELNPDLGKSINYDAFIPLVEISRQNSIKRFIYDSPSSSVYGIKEELEVTEDMSLEPLTDYSLYKAKCEEILLDAVKGNGVCATIIRPSTVCGYAPRLRLDLTVNILTNHALNNGKIKVFGGEQKRPNIHIDDMTDLYLFLLEQPEDKIKNKIYNAGYQNYKVREIAEIVNEALGGNIPIETTPSNDNRSYHVSSEKIHRELGFKAKHTLAEAVTGLKEAFEAGKIPDPMTDIRYYNIKMMQVVELT